MLIVCPACASEYQIAADHVGPSGRSVRCAACRGTWFIAPDEVAAALEAEGAGDAATREEGPQEIVEALGIEGAARHDAAFDGDTLGKDPLGKNPLRKAALDHGAGAASNPEAPRARRSGRSKKSAAKPRPFRMLSPAAAAGLVLFVLLPLALLGRSTVVRAMPQTAGLFAAIGLPVNLRGVDLRDVVAFRIAARGDSPAELVVEGELVGVARGRVDVPPVEVEIRDAQEQPLYRWTVPAPRTALEPGETARFRASLSAPPEKGRHVELRFSELRLAGTEAEARKDTGARKGAPEAVQAKAAETAKAGEPAAAPQAEDQAGDPAEMPAADPHHAPADHAH